MKKKIYIAGKVSGEPIAKCAMKFGAAQIILEAQGWQVVNPLAVVNDWHTTWLNAMKQCIPALMECDAIYLLPDWSFSNGAMLELTIARQLQLEIIEHR